MDTDSTEVNRKPEHSISTMFSVNKINIYLITLLLIVIFPVNLLGSPRFVYTTGNALLDREVAQEVNILQMTYHTNPKVMYFDDTGAPSAKAGQNGTILLGLNLIKQEFLEESGPFGNYSVIGILAHEYAHIKQYEMGLQHKLPVKLMELHADYIAGWHIANRQMLALTDVPQAMKSLYRKEGYNFNQPGHHGTTNERINAFRAGLQIKGLNIMQAMQMGFQYVTSNFSTEGNPLAKSSGQPGCALLGNFNDELYDSVETELKKKKIIGDMNNYLLGHDDNLEEDFNKQSQDKKNSVPITTQQSIEDIVLED